MQERQLSLYCGCGVFTLVAKQKYLVFPRAVKVLLYFLQEADSDPTGEAADKTQQLLTYYELDLGLNHVVRKFSEQLEEHANFLISGNKTMPCFLTCKFALLCMV